LRSRSEGLDLYDSLLEGLWVAVQQDGDAASLGRAATMLASMSGFPIDQEGAEWIGLDLALWWDHATRRFNLD